MQTEFNEKQLFIQQTSDESIEFVVNWFQRLINEIIECQTQIIENIQHERDRAFEQLDQFKANLSSCQIKKQIDLPEFHLIQPRYEISYQFHDQKDEEENWDLETTDSQYQSTTVNLFPSNLQTIIKPKDDDEIIVEDVQFQSDTIDKLIRDTCDYYLDPTIYYPGTPIHLSCDINLICSNGNHLLCYSRQTKQIVYIYDENLDPITLSWYHGHIIQLVWFDQMKSFVILTDHQHYEIYTIELTNNFRLKIRLRTYLTTKIDEIRKEKILLQTDANHLFIYYEKSNERKYLRLLNLSFECVRLYSLDKYVSSQEKILALGIDDRHIVLFVRSVDGLCLLIINKSKMCFIDRWILTKGSRESQLIVYFQTISSYFLLEQSILRFYQFDRQIGEIDLNSTTNFSSIILQNDGSFIFSNNTKDLLVFHQ